MLAVTQQQLLTIHIYIYVYLLLLRPRIILAARGVRGRGRAYNKNTIYFITRDGTTGDEKKTVVVQLCQSDYIIILYTRRRNIWRPAGAST